MTPTEYNKKLKKSKDEKLFVSDYVKNCGFKCCICGEQNYEGECCSTPETEEYTVTINYATDTLNPLTLILKSNNFKREIGFYRQEDLESNEEFISRELSTFLETIKDLSSPNYQVLI